ncbi:MAG: hypothetical protein IPL17_04380 [Anaerolineales bacterium]|nr:hypothetical protein [Anaerolineales bacterium]
MRMFAGFGTAKKPTSAPNTCRAGSNVRIEHCLDFATLMGYDTDQPEALGEFGKCEVAISSLKDMEISLEGIPLEKVPVKLDHQLTRRDHWAMYPPPPKSRD